MPVTAFASGTQNTNIGTEHFLANVDEPGVFVFEVDTNALAAGDVVELRAYKMILTGGTAREENVMTYYGVQEMKIKRSLPLSNELNDAESLRFSIKQTFGSSRAIPWKVLKHA